MAQQVAGGVAQSRSDILQALVLSDHWRRQPFCYGGPGWSGPESLQLDANRDLRPGRECSDHELVCATQSDSSAHASRRRIALTQQPSWHVAQLKSGALLGVKYMVFSFAVRRMLLVSLLSWVATALARSSSTIDTGMGFGCCQLQHLQAAQAVPMRYSGCCGS